MRQQKRQIHFGISEKKIAVLGKNVYNEIMYATTEILPDVVFLPWTDRNAPAARARIPVNLISSIMYNQEDVAWNGLEFLLI